MTEPVRLLIADDHPLFREGVAHTLNASGDLSVVAQAASAEEAVRLATEHLPDVALLDITMPGGGLNAARAIAATCPVTKIIMLTVSEAHDDLMTALKAGARAYVLKGIAAPELIQVVRAVAQGEVYVTPSLAGRLLIEMGDTRLASPLDDLTEREREILQLVAASQTNREIGLRLHLAEKTVKHYITNILQKLHVRSRVEAALLAHHIKAPGEEANP